MRKLIYAIALTLFLGFSGTILQAQVKGKAVGVVKSNMDHNTLMFAKVIVFQQAGVTKMTSTDMDGRFNVTGLDTGVYDIMIIDIAKKHDTLKAKVRITNKINLAEQVYNLDPKSKVVGPVKVRGSSSGSAARVTDLRRNSDAMKDIIGSEQIKASTSSDGGDVIKKITGASIQNGKFAIIRGLSDRYNFALINGAPLPSSEADRKAFSFDMFPASQLESMSINKTATPDMPSEFSGGVINIETRDIPIKPIFSLGFSLGYHNLTTLKNFNTYDGGKLDFLGVDDGTRAVPSNLPNSEDYINLINNKVDLIEPSQQFSANFGSRTIQALPNLGFNINLARPFKLFKKEAGFNFSTVYKRNLKFNETINRNYDGDVLVSDYLDKVSNTTVFIGSMFNFTYNLSKASKIGLKTIANINSQDQVIDRTGRDVNAQNEVLATALFYQQNTLISSQLYGKHALKQGMHSFDWNVAYSKISKIIPDFRRIRYQRSELNPEDPFTIGIPPSPNPAFGGRFFSELSENVISANYDYLMKDVFKNAKQVRTNIKLGGFHQMRQRSFSARVFGYVKFNSRNFDLDETMDANSIYAQDNISKTGFILQEGTNKSDAYDGTSTLHAAYVMADQNIFKKLKIVYGFRAEHFNQQLNSFKGLDPITINTSKVDILPSINASITLSEKSKLRLAASNTLSRPEFREIAPFNFYDFAQAFEVGGNPNLSRTSILNYDLRFEHYFGGSQLFSASLFYKDFTDPIEQVTGSDITSGSIATSYANAISAKNYGFEIEVRRNLDFLLHDVKANFENWKNYFFMFANYAWIRSEVDVSNVPGAETRPLQGQSPYVINAGVNFNDPERQISGGLSFNQVGKRIVFVGTDVFPDLYEKARSVIDMQITSRMAKQGKMKNVVIKLQARDILSQNIIISQNLNMNNTNYEAGKSTEFRLTNPGRNAKISISYTF